MARWCVAGWFNERTGKGPFRPAGAFAVGPEPSRPRAAFPDKTVRRQSCEIRRRRHRSLAPHFNRLVGGKRWCGASRFSDPCLDRVAAASDPDQRRLTRNPNSPLRFESAPRLASDSPAASRRRSGTNGRQGGGICVAAVRAAAWPAGCHWQARRLAVRARCAMTEAAGILRMS